MTELGSAKETEAPHRKLNPRDEKLFERWRKIFSTNSYFSADDNSRKGYTLDDIPAPKLPKEVPTGIAPRNRITPEPKTKKELQQENERNVVGRQHTACQTLVNKLFEKSPLIMFLFAELKKVGCNPPVFCGPCDTPVHGAFNPEYGIAICQNNNSGWKRMETTLAHEMIHAFDHCRFKVDPQNLKHVACGEVYHNISCLI
jgi:Peptidase M76 family